MSHPAITRCPSCGAWTTEARLDTTGCPTCALLKARQGSTLGT
jgi:Zn finger protein HypA/HybF involved in hydrogenase expression